MSRTRPFHRGGALAVGAVMATSVMAFAQVNSPTPVTVTVNAEAPLATVPGTALGVNTAVWDGQLLDPSVPALLRNIHATMLRYPGGSTSDVYNWATNTVTGGYADPSNTFKAFMGVAQSAGARPIITVNGGTGTAEEAAAWVKYANVTHHFGVKYWEIGNELYGSWEAGNFANNPQGYAKMASAYMTAMKAVDPSIQIGVDLIAPGTGEANWNSTVLGTLNSLGTLPNFGIVHWYPQNPGGETDMGLLTSTQQIGSMMSVLKQQLDQFGTPIPVFVTETNSVSYNPGRQTTSLTNALFLANDMMDWLQSGASNVDWWDLHNGATAGNAASTLYGTTSYGDYGLLSNGSSVNGVTEPPPNTPFPDYYGYQMLGPLVSSGATLVGAGSSNAMVSVHASKLANGNLSVMLVNRNVAKAYPVNLMLQGFQATGPVTEISYGKHSAAPTSTVLPNHTESVTVSPYSITDLIFQGTGQSANMDNRPADVTSSTIQASPTVQPSHVQTVSTTFRDIGASINHATLVVQLYNPAGDIVDQAMASDVSLNQGQTSSPVSLSYTPMDVQGVYTVRTFAFAQGSTGPIGSNQNAASFTVTAPESIAPGDVSVTTTLSANTVKVGTPVTITTTYVDNSTTNWLSNGVLDQYVFFGNNFQTQFATNDTLAPGQTITNTATFTPSSQGTYAFPVGLFTSNYAQLIQWIPQSGVTLTVN